MQASRIVSRTAALVLGLSVYFIAAPASAQLWSNPFIWRSYHDYTFTAITDPVEYVHTYWTLYGSWSVVFGFGFTGTTTTGQQVAVRILGPGGNIIGSRIDQDEFEAMRAMVDAFHDNPQYYSTLRFDDLEKLTYSPLSACSRTSATISVADPVRGGSGFNGGVHELTVHASGDFSLECLVRRDGTCSGWPYYETSRISILRHQKAFILNRQTWSTTLNPPGTNPSIGDLVDDDTFVYFTVLALDGRPWISVSGARKLEHNDPYHLTRGGCGGSTRIVDWNPYISIQGDGV